VELAQSSGLPLRRRDYGNCKAVEMVWQSFFGKCAVPRDRESMAYGGRRGQKRRHEGHALTALVADGVTRGVDVGQGGVVSQGGGCGAGCLIKQP
jgi:hypothetical protein